MAANSRSLLTWCWASIRRTVPLRERITRLCVRAPRLSNRTPRNSAPSVSPVAAKKQLSLLIKVETCLDHGGPFLVALRRETSLDLATHRLARRCGDDPLGGATDAEEHVGARIRPTGGHRAVDVAVCDQPDPRTARSDLADQIGVTRPVEDDHGEVAYLLAL